MVVQSEDRPPLDKAVPRERHPELDQEFLRKEYFCLHEMLEAFDGKALTIKAWSVTLSMAGIGAAFVQKKPILLLLSGVASLLFWLIEAQWKAFQQSFYPRVFEIERLMAGGHVDHPTSPQISSSWGRAWKVLRKPEEIRRIALWPHVFLRHALVFVSGAALWTLNFWLHFVGN